MVVGIFTFSALIVRPFAGKALETKGRRFVFLFGPHCFCLYCWIIWIYDKYLLTFCDADYPGGGWGFSTTASGTIATDLIPAKRRGEGMGYYGLFGNIAIAIGPALGLILAGVISF